MKRLVPFQKRLDKPVGFQFDFALTKAQETPDADDEGQVRWIVEGYCAVAGNVDEQLDRIEKSALSGAIEFLKSYTTVLFNHNPDRPIGKILDASIKEAKIWVQVQISKSEAELWNKVVEGIINSFSISGDIEEFAYEYDKELKAQIRIIKKFRIYEISLVSVPANSEAKTLVAYMTKSLGEAGYPDKPPVDNDTPLLDQELFNIIMEVMKAMDWKAKLAQAIKSLGEIAAKVSDASVQDALKNVQKLLTDVASEAPQNYPDASAAGKSQELEGRFNILEKKVEGVEATVTTIKTDFEKKFGDLDVTLGSLTDLLKTMITEENPPGGSGAGAGGGAE
jgi:HK97 family phage prohead protease